MSWLIDIPASGEAGQSRFLLFKRLLKRRAKDRLKNRPPILGKKISLLVKKLTRVLTRLTF